VKPGNIMLTAGGEVKVMDFGIAAAAWDSRLTATGSTLGTATYVSPEQATGDRVTPASDVYSLGIVLYEMLAGRPPFTEGGPIAVASAQVQEPPPPLTDVAPWTPPAVAAVCERALAKDPAGRPPSASAFAAMLAHPGEATDPLEAAATAPLAGASTEQLSGGPGPAPTTPLTTPAAPPVGVASGRPERPTRRRHGPAMALAAILVVGVAALLVLLGLNVGHTPAPAPSGPPPSSGPATVAMPRLRGTSISDAKAKLTSLGWSVGDVHVQQAKGPRGEVVGTDPPQGTSVRPGTPVTLLVGTGHGPKDEHGKPKKHGGGD
jgi:serine/threonine-protein kinase